MPIRRANILPHIIPTALALLAATLLTGCGGDGRPRTSTVTGTVVDTNFQPLRDAEVEIEGQRVRTTNTGSFAATNVPNGEIDIIARATVNGTRFRGRTQAFTSENEQENSVNIVVAPESQLGTLTGTVRDRDGFPLRGASVFAYMGTSGSARAFTGNDGRYTLRDLPAGFTLTVSASGRTFRSDQTSVVLNNGQTRNLNFNLGDAGIPNLNPPTNIGHTTWVAPPPSRDPENASLAWAKSRLDQRDRTTRPQAVTRSLRPDMSVETELFWDEQTFPDKFGVGVYRGNGPTGVLSGIDFFFDPLAPYYVDIGLNPSSTYSYALTTTSALFPEFPDQTESRLSDRVVVRTLDLLRLSNVTSGPRFNWQAGSGAQEFIVYLFDRFPTAGAQQIWDTEQNPTTGLSQLYTGGSLVPGRTYFYIVLGVANSNNSRTISPIGSFVP